MTGAGEEEKSGRKIFHRLVTPERAREILSESATHDPGSESVGIWKARGRMLSESIFSSTDLPPFDRAEMDGYAVLSGDLEGASEMTPVKLKIAGAVKAGDQVLKEMVSGECLEIATGAPLPRGADSVVMVEYTARDTDFAEISRPTTPGENVASTGSDIQVGEMVLRDGTLLGVREIGVLAAIGAREVMAKKRPKVGIIATGDELVDLGDKPGFGRIYDANSPALSAAVEEAGGSPVFLGRATDDLKSIKTLIAKGLQENDLLLISGGTSAGMSDLVYKVLEDLCRPGILVHGLNVKPGKPTIIAVDNGKAVFGLPGYPVSALIIFDQIVRPYLEKLAGLPQAVQEKAPGRLAFRVNGAKGRRWLLPVHFIKGDVGNIAFPIISSSGAIGTLSKADGYITVGEDKEFLDAGEEVYVSLFVRTNPDLNIMGSHCPGLDLLLQLLFHGEGITAKTANIGSLGGIEAVKRGEADIAGIHLLDETTMKYNESFVAEAGLPGKSLTKGYKRLQGIIIANGNPKGIKGMGDLLREELIFVNRNRGSGTRVLTDHLLKQIAQERGIQLGELAKKIRGYHWEAKTHSAVAAAVHQGRADLGIGVKSVAEAYKLDFIPIGYEEYDFVINPRSIDKKPVKAFLRYLHSDLFKKELGKLPGYTIKG